MSVRWLGRRAFLQTSLAGLVLSLWPWRARGANNPPRRGKGRKGWPEPPPRVRNPRFKRKKTITAVQTRLAPGFYIHSKSKVVHYVGEDRKIAGVVRINEGRLRPLTMSQVVELAGQGKPHLNLSRASRAFEEAALREFRAGRSNLAFDLLEAGIRHDQRFKRGILEAPSVRLYDLGLGMSVQLGQASRSQQLLAMARSEAARPAPEIRGRTKVQRRGNLRVHRRWKLERKEAMKVAAGMRREKLLPERLDKWSASKDNAWRRRWLDKRRPRSWKL